MKVTFMEEIEARKAWFDSMYCSVCGEGYYRIHHQLQPPTLDGWWLECENCEHESIAAPTREAAIARWKDEC